MISEELTKLQNAKKALKDAENKYGLEITDTTPFTDYATKINNMFEGSTAVPANPKFNIKNDNVQAALFGTLDFTKITNFYDYFRYIPYKNIIIDLLDVGNLNNIQRLFNYNTTLETVSINIKNNVPARAEYLFNACTNLKYAVVSQEPGSASLTQFFRTFQGDKELRSVTFKNLNVSESTVTDFIFHGCTKLGTVEGTQNLNLHNSTSIQSFASGCNGLTYMDLRGWDLSNCTNAYSAFYSCNFRYTVDASNWITPKLTNIESIFQQNSSVTSFNCSGWDTSKVTNFYGVFKQCPSLQSLNLTGWDFSSATDIRYFLQQCLIIHLTIPNFNPVNPIRMDYMFENSPRLQNLTLQGTGTIKPTSMASMFMNCYRFTGFNFSRFDTSQCTSMSAMFAYCDGLGGVDYFNKLDTSKVTTFREMFRGCMHIEKIDTSKLNTSSCTDLSLMFHYCRSLKAIDVSSWDTSNVTNFGSLFEWCDGLATITGLDNLRVTSKATNIAGMFSRCTPFTDPINASNWDVSNVTHLNSIFYSNGSIGIIVLGWRTSNVQNWSYAFGNMPNLTRIDGIDYLKFSGNTQTVLSFVLNGCTMSDHQYIFWENAQFPENVQFHYFADGCQASLIEFGRYVPLGTPYGWNMNFIRQINSFRIPDGNTLYNRAYNYGRSERFIYAQTIDTSMLNDLGSLFPNGTYYIEGIDLSSVSNGNNCSWEYWGDSATLIRNPLHYCLATNLGKGTATVYNLWKWCRYWGAAFPGDDWWDELDQQEATQSVIDTLVTYSYNRTANGLAPITVYLHQNTKDRLPVNVIAQAAAKGITIA